MAVDQDQDRHRDLGREPQAGMTVGRLTLREDRSRTVKVSERVAQQIVRDIAESGLQTGDRLAPESDLVDQYKVSRFSLREALRLLEAQGLIWHKRGPGGGPVVGTIEPSHLARTAALYFHLGAATYNEIMRTQVMLESMCASLAAGHPDRVERLTPYFVHDGPDPVEQFREASSGFHGVVYELADNAVLSLLTQAVSHTVTQHVITTMDPVELRSSILDEHATLARAIAAGDAPGAGRLAAEHFDRQHRHLRDRWPRQLEELIKWH